jgi:hypothetical protein
MAGGVKVIVFLNWELEGVLGTDAAVRLKAIIIVSVAAG